jgi:magnesium-transporting ATPase (P-type)
MVTGDNAVTAEAIAKECNIISNQNTKGYNPKV